ncbi:tail fiber domain-containing protein [Peredibacter starrii]|uniref:Tail fiber domain-containing protein n=1 Tax=Peredibacter starrii TaxID=28202 RepID=A0AAX4HQM9_9BACT|nr:tail fiber domain-containing protein [Peredibacter starrii]WPU65635.1 tail fiber domain-containing protein [Peredibacter starrii]
MWSNKQSGFSLLEIMVASALLGGLALAGAKLMENQTKNMKTVEVRGEYQAVLTDIRSILAVAENCRSTFNGINLSTPSIAAPASQRIISLAPDNSPQPRYQANSNWRLAQAYGNGQVRILSYRITTSPDPSDPEIGIPAAAPAPPATTKLGAVNLHVTFHFGEGRTVGAETIERKIRLNVEVNAANTLVGCTSTGGLGWDARYIWRVGGTAGVMTGNLTMSNNALIILQAGSSLVAQNGTSIVMQDSSVIDFTSDQKFKYDVRDLNGLLPKIRETRPVRYKWKSNNKEAYGVIAQELQEIFPELVRRKGPNNSLTVDYIQLTPLLLQGLKEMDIENKVLKSTIKELKNEQVRMQGDLENLKKMICKNNQSKECFNQ